SKPGDDRNITVDLSSDARAHYRDAEVRYRRAFQSGNHDRDDTPTLTRRRQADPDYSPVSPSSSSSSGSSSGDYSTTRRKRGPVNEDGSPIGSPSSDDSSSTTTGAKPAPPKQQ
ncbi:MAG TPA: hypothetical protein VKG79_17365, partial [Bryobacteraceae bacterium]|nr:hypothetical protein [Bryobacteraceae bacterium]